MMYTDKNAILKNSIFKSKGFFLNNRMKNLDSHKIPHRFLAEFLDTQFQHDPQMVYLVERLITGIITQEKPSPHKIHQELVQGESLKTFYRTIHKLTEKMPMIFEKSIQAFQNNAKIAMKSDGVISLDEHLIPHTSSKMEGVDYFHSSSENGEILAQSIISTHYYRKGIEYPVSFQFYRRERELEKWDKTELYRKKNEIAREEFEKICALPDAPSCFLMDSYFMTKDNCSLLQQRNKTYISRPKRNWKGTYEHRKQFLAEIYESIPDDEFQITCVKNPKSFKKAFYKTATRNIFFPKIGSHQVVFVKIMAKKVKSLDLFKNVEEMTDSRGYSFRVFITNDMDMAVEEILSLYSLRWTIETGYRDMSQNLGLHGCIWRELSGQYCFIALTFLCYIFLMWAKNLGAFSRYNVELRTLGQLRTAYRHYCQEEFSLWLGEIRGHCRGCTIADWFYEHVFSGG